MQTAQEPKAPAARFLRGTCGLATIGAHTDAQAILGGRAGTTVLGARPAARPVQHMAAAT